MSFNYYYTCPLIDEGIERSKDHIEEELKEMHQRVLDGESIDIEDYVKSIYVELEAHFEAVRTSNENIRSAAEDQINDLETEVHDHQVAVNDAEAETQSLSEKIDDLDTEIFELKKQIKEMELCQSIN